MVDSFFVNPAKPHKRRSGEDGAPRAAGRGAGSVKSPRSGSTSRAGSASKQTNRSGNRGFSRRGAASSDSDTNGGLENGPDMADSDFDFDSDAAAAASAGDSAQSSDSESDHETAADKRRRLAREYLSSLEDDAKLSHSAGGVGGSAGLADHEFDAADLDREIVGRRLREDVHEEEDRIFRRVAQDSEPQTSRARLVRTRARNLTAVAVHGSVAYSVSKDMMLQKWQLPESGTEGNALAQSIKTIKAGSRHAGVTGAGAGHCGEIVCVSCSADGQYVATGGRDRRIAVWTGSTLALLHVFEVRDRKADVFGLAFRRAKGCATLYAACGDLRVRSFDVAQGASVEQLYGHQDSVLAVSALSAERCVTVGARDRTAILWKIPEESRLSLRSGDTKMLAQHGQRTDLALEGSLDCVAMLDGQHFVTGSDNGLLQLWTVARKKPLYGEREAHGLHPKMRLRQHTGERSACARARAGELPAPRPCAITAVAAIPLSDVFVSGSETGKVKVWRLCESDRKFQLVREVKVGRGIVTGIAVSERGRHSFSVVATVSREPRLDRQSKVSGHDTLAVFGLSL